jgi:excisionase family DNA binding protein
MDRQKKITGRPDKIALQIPEVAYVSGLSRTKIYALIKRRMLASVKVDGRRLVLCADLERYLSSLRSA